MVNELRGEKVDVVEWREDKPQFIAEALGPAKVQEVRIDEATETAVVIVSDHQLSLAIGKEGQNARLAARLSGYRVDIRSDLEESGGEADAPAAAAEADTAADAAEAPIDAAESVEAVESGSIADTTEETIAADDSDDGTVDDDAAGDANADDEGDEAGTEEAQFGESAGDGDTEQQDD